MARRGAPTTGDHEEHATGDEDAAEDADAGHGRTGVGETAATAATAPSA